MLLASSAIVHAQNAYTNRTASLRAGPDRSYPLVVRIDAGAPVDVMGCLDDWSWCDVAFDDARGWVYSPSLSYVYEGSRVPFYTYAPTFGLPVITFSIGTYWDHYYRGRPWYAQRNEWTRRTIPHRRPPGPPPRTSRPPLHAQEPGARSPGRVGSPIGPRPGSRPDSGGGPPQAAPERSGRAPGEHGGTAAPEREPRENAGRPATGREITPRRGAVPPRSAPARGEHPQGEHPQGEHPQGEHPNDRGNQRHNEGQGEPPR